MSAVIDWQIKPEPWRTIGLRAQREFQAIASGAPMPPPGAAIPRPEPRRAFANYSELAMRRRALGLTQQELAAAAGVYRSNVSTAEQGMRRGTIKRLGVTLDRLEAERGQS